MATLTEQQNFLLRLIPKALGEDPSQKDWAPVMDGRIWDLLTQLPEGLVETHQKFAPIIRGFLGIGFVRLTDAGRAAIAERGEG